MLVKVADIPEEGLRVRMSEDAGTLKDLDEDVRLSGPVTAEFALKVIRDTVYVTGTVKGSVELECSRCGRGFSQDVDAEVSLDLNPVESLASEEEKELTGADLDVEFYSGGLIDLSVLVAEQLALGIPMKPLCSEDCPGVCQYCGKDLREGECGCEAVTGHPGLAGLKELMDKVKPEGEGRDG